MRLPAVAIAAAFACGVALGLHPAVARNASSFLLLSSAFIATALLIAAGVLLVRNGRVLLAAVASLLSWAVLGFAGTCVAEQPRDANEVISLVEQGHLSLKTPLRWHGHLRDAMRLPWGYGYEIELSGVEFEGALHAARGGLRLSFAPRPGETAPAGLHAGDEVAVLTAAKRPQVFRDDGAFDRRAYLAQQNIDLVATRRAPQLIERIGAATPTVRTLLARARRRLRDEIDELFAGAPQAAGVLRAMLLGDRSFVDRAEAADFQKTGVFRLLVVAGLHVGALAFALYGVGRKLRLSRAWTMLFTLTLLPAYVAVVEERAPVLRAAMMAAIVLLGGFFYRRLELLNSGAVAALILLVAWPLSLRDSSFQLTFVAIGCIAGLALPWLEKSVQPYVRALRGWRDVSRDAAHEPQAIEFRIDLRLLSQALSARVPWRVGRPAGDVLVGGLSVTFRIWELLVITLALQTGMLPMMVRDFHRVTLSARLIGAPLAWLTTLLLQIVHWFAHFPRWSYRIPGPPFWLVVLFFVTAVLLATEMRLKHSLQKAVLWGSGMTFLACALTMAVYPFGAKWTPGSLELTVLDVGQGDSLFVRSRGQDFVDRWRRSVRRVPGERRVLWHRPG